ncbi:MAG: hypothetical protein GEU83_15090 [Pseudonocardiaceae bacterium]|nr:hypothetical protein [Pseudonocardiaceae bacterium]
MARKSMIRRPGRNPSPARGKGKGGWRQPGPDPLNRAQRAAINAVVTDVLAAERARPTRADRDRRAERGPAAALFGLGNTTTAAPTVPTGPGGPGRAAEQARRDRIRAGRAARRWPFKATAATAAAGYGAWGAAELAEVAAGPAGHLLASTTIGTLALGAAATVGAAYRKRIGAWRRHYWCATCGAASWITLTSIDGAGWGLLATLVAGAAAVSTGWLRAHEVPVPPVEQPDVAVPPVTAGCELDTLAARWATEVAGNPKLAPDSALTDGRQHGNHCEYTLELAAGMTLGKLRGLQEGIASAMRLDPMQLTFAPAPAGAHGFRDSSKVAVQIILSSPITGPVYWREPAFTYSGGFGRIGLGPYIDGEAQAAYELFRPRGMFSGVVIGSTGKGKSSVVNGIVVSARSSGMVTTWYLDPKGNSSPDLARHATVSEIGLERAEAFTVAAETLVRWLGKQAAANNQAGFAPSADRPGYLIVIDECDMLFAIKGMAQRWGQLAKTGRSLGLSLLLATQYAGMTAFGGSELLRSSVRVGNVVLMRTESNTSDALIAPDLPKSTTLPSAPGYAYLKNEGAAPAALKNSWLLTSDEPTPECFPDELADYNADVALAAHPDAAMCPIGAKAAQLLTEVGGQEREETRAARLRDEIARFLAAPLPAPAATPAGSGPAEPAPVLAGMGARFTALPGPLAPVVPLHPETAVETAPAAASASLDPNALPGAQRAVLAALNAGHTKSGEIGHATGLAAATVSRALTALGEHGLAQRRGFGEWTATDGDQQQAS